MFFKSHGRFLSMLLNPFVNNLHFFGAIVGRVLQQEPFRNIVVRINVSVGPFCLVVPFLGVFHLLFDFIQQCRGQILHDGFQNLHDFLLDQLCLFFRGGCPVTPFGTRHMKGVHVVGGGRAVGLEVRERGKGGWEGMGGKRL